MSMLTRGRSRFAALGTAGALAASALVFAAPAAQAAEPEPAPVLTWSISQYYIEHLSSRTLVDGAQFDEADNVFTFPGAGTSVAGNGQTTYTYEGAVTGLSPFAGYGVTVADPQVTVAADGSGSISAVISATDGPTGTATSGPARVTVAEFSDAEVTGSGVSAVPNWVGVLPAGSQRATELGIGAGLPVDGKSFHPDFIGAVTGGTAPLFYASNKASDPKKQVGSFIAEAVPTVTTSVLSASSANGVDVRIAGAGFNPSTNTGDAGVYVGVAPSDAVIDFDDRVGGTAAMVAVDWVMPSQFNGGSFTKVLNLPTAKLDKTKAYSVYTWQAHTHSNTTQDTKTPFVIDWNALTPPVTTLPPTKVAPKLTLKVTKAPTARKAGRAVLTVKGSKGAATGKVKVQVLKGKKVVKRLGTKSLKKGKLAIALPKRPKGTYKLKVTYAGNASYKAASKVTAFKVRKR